METQWYFLVAHHLEQRYIQSINGIYRELKIDMLWSSEAQFRNLLFLEYVTSVVCINHCHFPRYANKIMWQKTFKLMLFLQHMAHIAEALNDYYDSHFWILPCPRSFDRTEGIRSWNHQMVQHARGEFGIVVWNKCQRDVSCLIHGITFLVFGAVAAATLHGQLPSINH